MGNRAVITTKDKTLGVYLHWNGGRDSVEAFLKYCELKGYRCPEKDCYGWARLCQVLGNFFGGECSVGIDLYDRLDRDNGDNGVYIIENWKIVGREFAPNQEQSCYDLTDCLIGINEKMPLDEQIEVLEPKEKLLRQLEELSKSDDTEASHVDADRLILNYLDDEEIKKAYDKIKKWYS